MAKDAFRRNLALLIGVDSYADGIPSLRTPVADVEAIAALLSAQHGYEIELLCEETATLDTLRSRLNDLRYDLSSEDRLIVYFAGHGVAMDGEAGPEGFLMPHGAVAGAVSTYLPMAKLQELLSVLPCRHLLLILDCCFAGAFRWTSVRDFREPPHVLHKERYRWFIDDRAWQVLASSAHDQKALDVVAGDPIGDRGETQRRHSPFAAAFMDRLAGAADAKRPGSPSGDGIITVTELFLYLREALLPSQPGHVRQTPSLWPLPKHDKGEFVFLVPGATPDLPDAPPLSLELNPWRGLLPYGEEDAELFFGRAKVVTACADRLERDSFLAIVGPSGSGKSSLLHAGVLPRFVERVAGLKIVTLRPGEHPFETLSASLENLGASTVHATDEKSVAAQISSLLDYSEAYVLLTIDQLEELITHNAGDDVFRRFTDLLAGMLIRYEGRLKLCVTIRSDFEALFLTTNLGSSWRRRRFVPPPMTQDELRRCIEGHLHSG